MAVPWAAIRLERTRFFAASTQYEPLNAVAIGLLVLALGKVTHGNLFLAAFAAGITVATFGPRQREAFEHFGELVAELLKLAALLVFGALISPEFLGEIPWTGWVFAVLALVVARPVALWMSFLRLRPAVREQLAAMWFGPKGFASVVYGLLVLESGIAAADEIFHLVALTIVISILAHSSTDIVVARAFDQPEPRGLPVPAFRRLRRAAPAPAPDRRTPLPTRHPGRNEASCGGGCAMLADRCAGKSGRRRQVVLDARPEVVRHASTVISPRPYPTVAMRHPGDRGRAAAGRQNLPGLIVVDDGRSARCRSCPARRCCGWRCRRTARTTRRWPG